MGTDNDSRHIERNGQHGKQNTDTHSPAYGIDRYAYNQGYNALYDFQVFENQEPCLISRGGQPYVVRDPWIIYQRTVGSLCATDYKGVKNEVAEMDKLIIQKRTE